MPRHADAADADEMDQSDIERQRPHAATPDGERAMAGQLRRPDRQGAPRRRAGRRRGRPPPCRPDAAASRTRLARCPASVGGRELGVRDHDAGAGRLEGAGVGGLVIVGGVGIGHQDRRPADGGELGHGRGAGAADHQMRARPAAAAGRRRTAPARPRCRPAHSAARTCSRSSGRHCWTRRRRARSAGGSDRIASGTTWLNEAAPWLPPNTTRSIDAARGRRAIGRAAQRAHGLAHRIADQARAAIAVGDDAGAGERGRDPRRRRPAPGGWPGPARRSARAAWPAARRRRAAIMVGTEA